MKRNNMLLKSNNNFNYGKENSFMEEEFHSLFSETYSMNESTAVEVPNPVLIGLKQKISILIEIVNNFFRNITKK